MEFLIISGMSGAGKSQAADILEDMGYYCVDNLPIALLPRFAELCLASQGSYERVALVTDVRERESLDGLLPALDGLWDMGLDYRILFVEAERADHRAPLQGLAHALTPCRSRAARLRAPCAARRRRSQPVRERADYIINTTGLTTSMLQSRIRELLSRTERRFAITVTAFGYKHGLPIDADLVFDVQLPAEPVLRRAAAGR